MKIVSWNCNGAFRKKYETLDKIYDADIYVIQECENPELSKDEGYIKFGKNGLWQGYKNKGLGIFAKDNITLEPAKWSTYGLQYFIPCKQPLLKSSTTALWFLFLCCLSQILLLLKSPHITVLLKSSYFSLYI